MRSFEIAGRTVGYESPCYVIAEAGANHDRKLDQAKKLIDVAADAGADAVKFQTYSGSAIYSSKTPHFEYLKETSDLPPHELLESISLPREWQPELFSYANDKGITWFSSPFDHDAIDQLAEIGVPAYKIASFEIVDLELVAHAASKQKPVIISTGMATMDEIEDALEACRSERNEQVALLQCVSLYPAPARLTNLRAIQTMRKAFGVPVGLSDHTLGINIAPAAVAAGAELIEKHFTLDRSLSGPDHPFAVEPAELQAMVSAIREVESAMGDGSKDGPSAEESAEMYRLARRSLVAAVPIPAGTAITREMVTTKRPGWGIKPKEITSLLGKVANRDIEADEILTWEMF